MDKYSLQMYAIGGVSKPSALPLFLFLLVYLVVGTGKFAFSPDY